MHHAQEFEPPERRSRSGESDLYIRGGDFAEGAHDLYFRLQTSARLGHEETGRGDLVLEDDEGNGRLNQAETTTTSSSTHRSCSPSSSFVADSLTSSFSRVQAQAWSRNQLDFEGGLKTFEAEQKLDEGFQRSEERKSPQRVSSSCFKSSLQFRGFMHIFTITYTNLVTKGLSTQRPCACWKKYMYVFILYRLY